MTTTPTTPTTQDAPPRIEDFEWLVRCRSENQHATLRLLKQYRRYAKIRKSSAMNSKASLLLGVCFSHWRAVFLADKVSSGDTAFDAANKFLNLLVQDNAINYPQDRKAKEWTFNYYMEAGSAALDTLQGWWSEVGEARADFPKWKRSEYPRNSQWRWERQHRALTTALACFERDLDAAAKTAKARSGKK